MNLSKNFYTENGLCFYPSEIDLVFVISQSDNVDFYSVRAFSHETKALDINETNKVNLNVKFVHYEKYLNSTKYYTNLWYKFVEFLHLITKLIK